MQGQSATGLNTKSASLKMFLRPNANRRQAILSSTLPVRGSCNTSSTAILDLALRPLANGETRSQARRRGRSRTRGAVTRSSIHVKSDIAGANPAEVKSLKLQQSRRVSEQTAVDGRMKSWAGSGERRDEYQKQQRQRTGRAKRWQQRGRSRAFVMTRLGDRNTSKLREHQVREDPTVTNSEELRHLFMATCQLNSGRMCVH